MCPSSKNNLSYSEMFTLKDALDKENRKLFEKLCDTIDTAPVASDVRLEAEWDILQMLLDAERTGRRAQDVIGEDYAGFCQNVMAALPRLSWRERAWKQVCYVVLGLTCYFAWELLLHCWQLLRGAPDIWMIALRPNDLAKFMMMLLAFHAVRWFGKRQELCSRWRHQLVVFVMLVLAFALADVLAALVPNLAIGVPAVVYLLILAGMVFASQKLLIKVR